MITEFGLLTRALGSSLKSILSVRKAIQSTKNLFDDLEIDRIRKDLRAIYFYPDGFLKDIDIILNNDDSIAIEHALGRIDRRLVESSFGVQKAIDRFKSNDTAHNLRVDINSICEIREIGKVKLDIRSSLHGATLFQYIRGISADSSAAELAQVREQLRTVRTGIEKLNNAIRELESSLDHLGLQQRHDRSDVAGARKSRQRNLRETQPADQTVSKQRRSIKKRR